MNKDEIASLLVASNQDIVRAFEQEIDAEGNLNEDERKLLLRFTNLARKGAGMPEVAVQ